MISKKWSRRIKTLSSVTVLCILFAEFVLVIASVWSPTVNILTRAPEDLPPANVSDPRLGLKGNPDSPFNDANGYRNAVALEQADIVAVGDSHTYGTSVRSDEAWPSMLAQKTGETVYNISLGGYGAAHSNENLAVALSLKPSVVIFGLYFGNDFYEDFHFAERNGELSEYINADEKERINVLQQAGTIEAEVGFLFSVIIKDAAGGSRTGDGGDGVFRELARWSRLAGFIHHLKLAFSQVSKKPNLLAADFESAANSMTDRQRKYASPFDDGEWRTVLTAPYRFRVLDDSDLRIEVGQRITREMVGRMAKRVEAAGGKFGVVLLPTKEFVFGPRVLDWDGHPSLSALLKTEARMHREISAFLDMNGIPYVDVSDALRAAKAQPYFGNGDGHPNPLGHSIIAVEVAGLLERLRG